MIVVGEALVDLVEEADGRLDPRPGGAARNVALAAARLGGAVRFVGGLSTDALGRRLRRQLLDAGVDLSCSPVVDAPTPLAVVSLDESGDAEYAFHLAGTAALGLHADDLASLPGDEPLHVSLGAVTLATPEVGDALVATLASHDALCSLDPNVRPAFLTDPPADAARVDGAVSLVDLVRCSAQDVELLHPGRSVEDVVAGWLASGAGAVVVTRGADGAVAWSAAGQVRCSVPRRHDDHGSEPEVTEVVDSVGAGDTFGGALLVTLVERGVTTRDDLLALQQDDWLQVLRFANRAAAVTVRRHGADPPRRAEL